MSKDKDQITKKFLKKREQLSDDEVASASQQVFEKLLTLDAVQTAKHLMFYLPVKGELDFIKYFPQFQQNDIELSVPVVDTEELAILPANLREKEPLVAGPMGIMVPEDPIFVDTDTLDVVIVPGVAFDVRGARVGFGKGYYDRFLKKTHALRVGVAYDWQMAKHVPIHDLDVPMDLIVTPKKIYHFPDNYHTWRFFGSDI